MFIFLNTQSLHYLGFHVFEFFSRTVYLDRLNVILKNTIASLSDSHWANPEYVQSKYARPKIDGEMVVTKAI